MKPKPEKPDDRQTEGYSAERRNLLRAGAVGLAVGALGVTSTLQAQARDSAPSETLTTKAFFQTHQPKPLSFDPAKLKGLTTGMIESHWSNNYGGSVKALNEINKRL